MFVPMLNMGLWGIEPYIIVYKIVCGKHFFLNSELLIIL